MKQKNILSADISGEGELESHHDSRGENSGESESSFFALCTATYCDMMSVDSYFSGWCKLIVTVLSKQTSHGQGTPVIQIVCLFPLASVRAHLRSPVFLSCLLPCIVVCTQSPVQSCNQTKSLQPENWENWILPQNGGKKDARISLSVCRRHPIDARQFHVFRFS